MSSVRLAAFTPSDYQPLAALLTAVGDELVDPDALREADADLPTHNQFSVDSEGRLVGYGSRHLLAWDECGVVGRVRFRRAPWTRAGTIASDVDLRSSHPLMEAALHALLADQLSWAEHIGATEAVGVLDDRQIGLLPIFDDLGYRVDAHIVAAHRETSPDVIAAWSSEASAICRSIRPAIEVLALSELGADERVEMEHSLYALFARTLPDNPGHIDQIPQFDQWTDAVLRAADVRPEWIVLARIVDPGLDGTELAGVCMATSAGDGSAYVDYTGVHPDWRGLGIASLLKRRAGCLVFGEGIQRLVTEWDTRNIAIERANVAMGFSVDGGHRRVVRPL